MDGIFCIEGPWSDDLTDPAGVGSSLRLLAENLPPNRRERMPLVHRVVEDPDGVLTLLNRWMAKRYEALSVGFLTMHGTPGNLSTGRDWLSLEAIAEQIDGRGAGRWLHISGCSVLRVPEQTTDTFLRDTRLAGVSGYRRSVDWFDGMVFDLLLLGQLLMHTRWSTGVARAQRLGGGLVDQLGFTAHRRR
jgi:hypothetical protein